MKGHPLAAKIAIFILGGVLTATALFAAPPQLIRYQGRLTDDAGVPLDGTVSIVFSIYNAESGGTALWIEGHGALPITNGVVDMVHWNQRLSSPDEAVRNAGREALEQAIRDAHSIGGSSVLLVPGRPD